MTEELPPLVFLDMATKAAEYSCDWAAYEAAKLTAARNGIIAHARTLEITREALRLLGHFVRGTDVVLEDAEAFLAKHEPDIVPVDPDVEAAARIIKAYNGVLPPIGDADLADAAAQFKAELAGRK